MRLLNGEIVDADTRYKFVEGQMKNDKARFKLANWAAHGYEVEDAVQTVVLRRGDDYLLLDVSGNVWKATKAI